jgi:Tfp pilus assembly protein PilN
MKFSTKKTLGIDISESRISLALLKKSGKDIKLLKAVSEPMPDGAVENGNIKDAAILSRTLKRLKKSITVSTVPTAVSLFAEPTILQMINIPKQIPDNIGKFVNEQVKHFAALLGRKINSDFCGVSGISPDGTGANSVLAVAADKKRIANLVEMFRQAGISADAIEPAVPAYIRALHKEKIEGKFESNVVIALVRDDKLTLCVFRKQSLDFIRTRDIGELAGTEEICHWLAGQINTVIQSYEVKALQSSGQWETTIVADCAKLRADSEEALKAKIPSSDVQLLTSENAFTLSSISRTRTSTTSVRANEPSLAATGLAMKLLDTNAFNLGVNLLPEETVRIRATRKMALVTANIIAALLLTAMLAVAVSIWKVRQINKNVDQKKTCLLQETRALFEESKVLDEQIKNINNKLKGISKISNSQKEIYWPDLLKYVAKTRPKTICITSITSGKGSQVTLKGLAVSNEDVYLFTEKLKKSELIDSASIYETNKNDKDNRFINYEIRCLPAPTKGT